MYCIRVKADVDCYVCEGDRSSFRLSAMKSEAKPFNSIADLLQYIKVVDLQYEDFVVESMRNNEGKESSVFDRITKGVITFEHLTKICRSGTAMSKLHPGDKIEKGYTVVAVKQDAVKIWSPKNCILDLNWEDAMTAAVNFEFKWNKDGILPVETISTELLSKEEAEIMSQDDRMSGFLYWTSTEYSKGCHWYVCPDGRLRDTYNSLSRCCCPGIWVR